MRNIATKVDGVDTLPAAAFNSDQNELENIVTSADITLDPDAGPDSDLNMLSKAVAAYANAGATYQDSGAADAYVLAIASNLKAPVAYYDNMTVIFKAGNTNTGASTVNVNALGVKSITLPDGTALAAGYILSGEYVIIAYNLASDRFELILSASGGLQEGIIQSVVNQDGAVNTGTTIIPLDDTKPQNTEGDEYLSQAITPTNANSKLLIEATLFLANDSITASTYGMIAALFKDSDADALAVAMDEINSTDRVVEVNLSYEMTAGTTSTITFKVRAGSNTSGNTTFNGSAGSRLFGGAFISSLRITEIAQ